MTDKKPDFIPDCIEEMTITHWGRLFTEIPNYQPPESETYRLALKAGWPSGKPAYQAQLQQGLLKVWPNLFDDIEQSATELERLGRENYDAILNLTLKRATPGDDLARIQTYATAMAMVIVGQRELLTAVMPNIRKDTERGHKTVAKAAEGGREAQQKLREKRADTWKRWEQELYQDIPEEEPYAPTAAVDRYVGMLDEACLTISSALPKLQDALNSGAYACHYIFELVHHCWSSMMTDELLDRLREAEDKFEDVEKEVVELAKKLPYM